MGQAGIRRVFADDQEWAAEFLGQAGIPAPALGQQPFTNWARGGAGCFPACSISGQLAPARCVRQSA
eukprot:221016-Lingulodinium_polyedra.AAC.1